LFTRVLSTVFVFVIILYYLKPNYYIQCLYGNARCGSIETIRPDNTSTMAHIGAYMWYNGNPVISTNRESTYNIH